MLHRTRAEFDAEHDRDTAVIRGLQIRSRLVPDRGLTHSLITSYPAPRQIGAG